MTTTEATPRRDVAVDLDEKYGHQHTLRPYRLHLIDVPAWRLTTDVRRGERR